MEKLFIWVKNGADLNGWNANVETIVAEHLQIKVSFVFDVGFYIIHLYSPHFRQIFLILL